MAKRKRPSEYQHFKFLPNLTELQTRTLSKTSVQLKESRYVLEYRPLTYVNVLIASSVSSLPEFVMKNSARALARNVLPQEGGPASTRRLCSTSRLAKRLSEVAGVTLMKEAAETLPTASPSCFCFPPCASKKNITNRKRFFQACVS